jgi:8-amino-3,8-dideoxy-alpha-D-manno-octulosonate transaminase
MAGNELVGAEELRAITEIFTESGGVLFAHGSDARRNKIYRVRDFERASADYFGSKHCVAVNSGTAALSTALRAMGVGRGDEVITQAFTFVATVEAIVQCGATPIVVDVDESLNMCPMSLEAAITPATKCIVPVHMHGNPAKLTEILAIARKRNLLVLEDACQAIGATYKGKFTGSIADMGVFSLDFGKNITTGEGGLVFTSRPEFHKFAAAYCDHGHANDPGLPRARETAYVCGFNFRMTEMQAAVGLAQLKKLGWILSKNRENKAFMKDRITDALGGKIQFREITDPGESSDSLMFFAPSRAVAERVVKALAGKIGFKNVPDAMAWHFAAYWEHIWKDHPTYKSNFKEMWRKSEALVSRCFSLPVNVLPSKDSMEKTVDEVCGAIRAHI